MTDYYIFRHGDTETTEKTNIFYAIFNKKGGGLPALPILPKGVSALKRIGGYLKNIPIDACYTSPYIRCVESSKIVASEEGHVYKPDARIREFAGKDRNFSALKKRIVDFLKEIDKKNYKAVSICTHGAVVAAIKHLKTRGKFFFFQVLDFPDPGNLVIIKNGKVEKINFNR